MNKYERAARAAGWETRLSDPDVTTEYVDQDGTSKEYTSWQAVCEGEKLEVEDNHYSEGARVALVAFQMTKGSSGDVQSDIRDLFTELFHLTAEQNFDIEVIFRGAIEVFEQEAEERIREDDPTQDKDAENHDSS